tara:strand:- start:519 stop:830 length:312 start_codon:yes stop_codon:yes gene_type:complete
MLNKIIIPLIVFFGYNLLHAVEDNSISSLIDDFFASNEYKVYLESHSFSPQVVVPIRVESFTEVANLPNPILAKLFVEYIRKEHDLDSKVISQPSNIAITNPL